MPGAVARVDRTFTCPRARRPAEASRPSCSGAALDARHLGRSAVRAGAFAFAAADGRALLRLESAGRARGATWAATVALVEFVRRRSTAASGSSTPSPTSPSIGYFARWPWHGAGRSARIRQAAHPTAAESYIVGMEAHPDRGDPIKRIARSGAREPCRPVAVRSVLRRVVSRARVHRLRTASASVRRSRTLAGCGVRAVSAPAHDLRLRHRRGSSLIDPAVAAAVLRGPGQQHVLRCTEVVYGRGRPTLGCTSPGRVTGSSTRPVGGYCTHGRARRLPRRGRARASGVGRGE